MVFGTSYKKNIAPLSVGSSSILWTSTVKYLGVHLLCGRDVKFDLMPVKRAFYSSCNSIVMHSKNLNELAVLSLQESYSLSVLMYSVPAMYLSMKQINELGAYAGIQSYEGYLIIISGNL